MQYSASNAGDALSEPDGSSVTVTVECGLDVKGEQVVSFGMPFPRGLLQRSGDVRIDAASGTEVRSGSMVLARWRHLTDARRDGQSIRSSLLSFRHDCSAASIADYRVRWDQPQTLRLSEAPSASSVARGWRLQAPPQASEHPTTDNYRDDRLAEPITEPGVWVRLPRKWLMHADARGPITPIPDRRIVDFMLGYARSAVNDVPIDSGGPQRRGGAPALIDWRSEVEGWLFDRPNALWGVYVQTGESKWLRHAHRASQYYASWIALDDLAPPHRRGAFRKKEPRFKGDPGDPKYSTSGGLLTAYLLTGDGRLLDPIVAIADFVGSRIQTRLPPLNRRGALWTERQVAVALSAALNAFEATGEERFRKRARDIVSGLVADVDRPPPGYPSDMQGILLHSWLAHEGTDRSGWIISPWMSALLGDALAHYYKLSEDSRALELLYHYAKFVAAHGLVDRGCGHGMSSGKVPRYLASIPPEPNTDEANVEHAYDVMGLLYRGVWAGNSLQRKTGEFLDMIAALRSCALLGFESGRSAAAQYRLNPTRKFNWWFGTTTTLDWRATAVGDGPQ